MRTRRTTFDDTMGHTFSSLQEMCDFHGVSKTTYQDRRLRGLSEKECLTHGKFPYKGKSKSCTDHLGNIFPSTKAMCQYHKIPESRFYGRLRYGYTLEQALSPTYEKPKTKFYDHLKNEFDTIEQLTQSYGITISMYYQRLKKGWSLEKTLTTKPRHTKKNKIETTEDKTDHNGIQFDSIKQMCQHYGLEELTYTRRLERGWNKEKALTEPIDTTKHGKPVTDPFGFDYPTVKDMLKAYKVKTSAYFERSRAGYSLIEILGCIPLLNHTVKNIDFDDNLQLIKPIQNGIEGYQTYFLCRYKKHDIILHHQNIAKYCVEHNVQLNH